MTTARFIERFRYRRESIAAIHGWRNISRTGVGDCNDFAWTVLCLEEGGSWRALRAVLKGSARFYLAKSPENKRIPRHVVLWRGGYIDSTRREWRDDPSPHKLVVRLPFPWVAFRVLWGLIA